MAHHHQPHCQRPKCHRPKCHRPKIHRTLTSLGRLFSLAAFACGSPPSTREIDNSTNVYIYTGGQRESPPAIDVEDPRVAVNQRQLAELLGRPLRFELDAAVAARFGQGLHEAYVAGLESATGALTRCKRDNPAAFAYGAERLETLRLTYTAVRAREEPRVPLLEPTLTLPVAPNRPDLFNGAVLCAAFESGLAATSEARSPRGEAQRARARPSDPRLAALQECEEKANEVLRTERAGARRTLHAELVRCSAPLREILRSQPADSVLLSALRRAQGAWVQWLNAYLVELDERDQLALATDLFRSGTPELDGLRRGFDAPRFALPLIETWLRKGPPADRPGEFGTKLEQCVVSAVATWHWTLQRRSACRGQGYSDLATTAEGRQRLLEQLQRWNSELLTETAVVHTLSNEGAHTALALLETLAADRGLTHIALRAVARHQQWAERDPPNMKTVIDPAPLVAAAPSWWRKHPEHRAVYLYVLTQIASKNEGAVPWATLGQFLGARIDRATLRAYLALQPGNIWYVSQLRSAFEPGFARTPLLREALDAYLEAYQAGKLGRTFDARELPERMVASVCDGGSKRDLEQLRSATRELSEMYDQARGVTSYLSVIWNTPVGELCPTRKRAEQPPEPVLFGD